MVERRFFLMNLSGCVCINAMDSAVRMVYLFLIHFPQHSLLGGRKLKIRFTVRSVHSAFNNKLADAGISCM